jgi:hypothetical protein
MPRQGLDHHYFRRGGNVDCDLLRRAKSGGGEGIESTPREEGRGGGRAVIFKFDSICWRPDRSRRPSLGLFYLGYRSTTRGQLSPVIPRGRIDRECCRCEITRGKMSPCRLLQGGRVKCRRSILFLFVPLT